MAWVTSGGAMNGLYYIKNMHPRDTNLYEWMCAAYGTRKANNYLRAYTKATTSYNSDWFRFRLFWVKDEAIQGINVSWYVIMATKGLYDTTFGTQNFRHNLAHCYGYSTWSKSSNTDEQRSCTFDWESDPGGAEGSLWGLYDQGNNVYTIVSYESWKTKNVTNPGTTSTGVHWLFAGAVDGDYSSLATWPFQYGGAAANYWKWQFNRIEDIKVKVGSTWKNAAAFVKINNNWKGVTIPYVKVGGSWTHRW